MKWFWSDLHLDHDAIVTKMGRPAESPEHWREQAIDAINSNVGRGDCLYLLGDFAFKNPGRWKKEIQCNNIFLIVGNHEPSATKLQNVFGGNVALIKDVKCCGVHTVLCHYPMAYWDRSHYGSYHLYGHLHLSWERERMMDRLSRPTIDEPGQRRSMDVSPEASLHHFGEYRPFNEEDVHEILSVREGHDDPKIPNGGK
jgi:calcineurin-like phosphoesterase family protein